MNNEPIHINAADHGTGNVDAAKVNWGTSQEERRKKEKEERKRTEEMLRNAAAAASVIL